MIFFATALFRSSLLKNITLWLSKMHDSPLRTGQQYNVLSDKESTVLAHYISGENPKEVSQKLNIPVKPFLPISSTRLIKWA